VPARSGQSGGSSIPSTRETGEPRPDDYVWQGYELEDCLDEANAALEDDVVVTEEERRHERADAAVQARRALEPLERFFFGR